MENNLAPPRVNSIPIHRSLIHHPLHRMNPPQMHQMLTNDIFTNGDIPSEHKVNKALSRMTLGRQI